MGLAETMGSIGSTGLGIIVMIIFIGVLITIFALTLYGYKKRKLYQEYHCIIWEKDGFDQIKEVVDQAGIFVDKKTNNKRFFMKKMKVGLEPDNIPYVMRGSQKVVYLFRYGLKNFSFIKPKLSAQHIGFEVGEEDVNWALNSYERGKKAFTSSLLLQYMPFITISFVSMIILMIFIYFFKDFEVLKEMALAMKEAAQAMAQASSGTTVLQ